MKKIGTLLLFVSQLALAGPGSGGGGATKFPGERTPLAVNDIKLAVWKHKSDLRFVLATLENLARDHGSEDEQLLKKLFDKNKTPIFKDPKLTKKYSSLGIDTYQLEKNLKFVVRPHCPDHEGTETIAYAFNNDPGEICIAGPAIVERAKKQKVNRDNLGQKMVAIMIHELSHRRDFSEPEAEQLEEFVFRRLSVGFHQTLVRKIATFYAHLNLVGSIVHGSTLDENGGFICPLLSVQATGRAGFRLSTPAVFGKDNPNYPEPFEMASVLRPAERDIYNRVAGTVDSWLRSCLNSSAPHLQDIEKLKAEAKALVHSFDQFAEPAGSTTQVY